MAKPKDVKPNTTSSLSERQIEVLKDIARRSVPAYVYYSDED